MKDTFFPVKDSSFNMFFYYNSFIITYVLSTFNNYGSSFKGQVACIEYNQNCSIFKSLDLKYD